MAEEQRLIGAGKVVQQASVVFAGGEIVVVLADDGNVYGDLVHLCRALGLDGESQRERIEEQATRQPCCAFFLIAPEALSYSNALWQYFWPIEHCFGSGDCWVGHFGSAAYAYRREWVLSARATLQELLQMLLLFLLR